MRKTKSAPKAIVYHLGERKGDAPLLPNCALTLGEGEVLLDPLIQEDSVRFKSAQDNKQLCVACLAVIEAYSHGLHDGSLRVMSALKAAHESVSAMAGSPGPVAGQRGGSSMSH